MDGEPGPVRVVVHGGDPGRVATVLPGRGYSPDFPVLYYARALLLARGWTVREVRWGRLPADPAHWPGRVRRVAATMVEQAGDVERHLVVGKSLGTHALPLAATLGLPGIWLTPLLHDPGQVDALRRSGGPALVVGGTADPYWDHDVARELNAGGWSPSDGRRRLVELQGLDHSLEVAGDPQASVDALAVVTATVATFLDLLATATRTRSPGAPGRGSSGSRG